MTGLDAKILAARAVTSRLEPQAIEQLARRLPAGTGVISATNGKTSTAAMTASILERAGISLVHNGTGSNMGGGVAAERRAGR